MPARLLTPVLLGVVAGTALQLQQAVLWSVPAYIEIAAMGVALAALFAIYSEVDRWRSLGVLVASALLVFALCGLRAQVFLQQALDPTLEGRDVDVIGVIDSLPQRRADGTRFNFHIERAWLAGEGAEEGDEEGHQGAESRATRAVTLPPRVALGWYADLEAPPPLHPGQRWQWRIRLKAGHGSSNPHGFDYGLWLWEQGLQATGYVRIGRKDPKPQALGHGWRHPVEQARDAVRSAIARQLGPTRSAGVVAALVLGDQSAIERSDWELFRVTGTAHLVSISGMHIGLFAWLATRLIGLLWRRSARLCLWLPAPRAALLGGLLLASAYALFSGWGVPAQRTLLMLASWGGLRWQARQWPWPMVWLLALAVVLLWDPWALLQAGFWLSFVAVGVLYASGPEEKRSDDPIFKGNIATVWVVSRAWSVLALLREQALVTVALAPLTLLLFGQCSVVGLLANLFAIPWVTLLLLPLSLLGLLWPALWSASAFGCDLLAALLQVLANLPLSSYAVAAPPMWAAVGGLAGGLLLALRLPWVARLQGLPLLLPLLLWQAPRPAVGQFDVLAADIGQGTAVLVRTAQHSLLYDAGPRFGAESDAGQRVLVPLLRALDERLDLLLLSHRDSDHVGGAASVLAVQPQAGLLSSLEDGHPLLALRAGQQRCSAGQRWTWDGVVFELLHPQPWQYPLAAQGRMKSNAMSCVLRISNGSHSALLTGDIEQQQEHQLLVSARPEQLKADLLLVPHHGSKTSSSADFLTAVAPHIAWVQSGYRNRFGHPVASVLARYRERGIAVWDSPYCGAASWSSAQPLQVACERLRAPRYWQHNVTPALP